MWHTKSVPRAVVSTCEPILTASASMRPCRSMSLSARATAQGRESISRRPSAVLTLAEAAGSLARFTTPPWISACMILARCSATACGSVAESGYSSRVTSMSALRVSLTMACSRRASSSAPPRAAPSSRKPSSASCSISSRSMCASTSRNCRNGGGGNGCLRRESKSRRNRSSLSSRKLGSCWLNQRFGGSSYSDQGGPRGRKAQRRDSKSEKRRTTIHDAELFARPTRSEYWTNSFRTTS
mmetsp:Transcript_28231/g.63027  ORF Transcript_28231/g.63027 Transcript_28231/m.63027 type:complete len:241 (-) Transcript_28231:135-857(-)